MRYLVTGGSGYLGSHLVDRLASTGNTIVIFDKQFISKRNKSPNDILEIQGDVSNLEDVFKLVKYGHFDGIFHLAAKKSVSESNLDPATYWNTNLQGTRNILKFCKDQSLKSIVFTSSAAIYGNLSLNRGISENDPSNPGNVYGETKIAGEELMSKYVTESGASVLSMRCFNLAGTKFPMSFDKNGENVLPIIMRCLVEGNTFSLFGSELSTSDGSCVRDYVSVQDAADAHIKAMECIEKNANPIYEAINVSTGRGVSVLELVSLVEKFTLKRLNVNKLDLRSTDPVSSVGDNRKAKALLNWTTGTSIEQIVQQTVNSYL